MQYVLSTDQQVEGDLCVAVALTTQGCRWMFSAHLLHTSIEVNYCTLYMYILIYLLPLYDSLDPCEDFISLAPEFVRSYCTAFDHTWRLYILGNYYVFVLRTVLFTQVVRRQFITNKTTMFQFQIDFSFTTLSKMTTKPRHLAEKSTNYSHS